MHDKLGDVDDVKYNCVGEMPMGDKPDLSVDSVALAVSESLTLIWRKPK